MNEFVKLLQTEWLGAPILIWLVGSVLFGLILVVVVVLCGHKIYVMMKDGKRQIIIGTNDAPSSAKKH
jgi:hypothetical protein